MFYEAPHRVLESVADMVTVLGPQRTLILAWELTKRFEQVVRLPLDEAVAWLAAVPNRLRGEFVLIVSGAERSEVPDGVAARKVLATLLEELPASQAARLTARLTGIKRGLLYEWALATKTEPHDG